MWQRFIPCQLIRRGLGLGTIVVVIAICVGWTDPVTRVCGMSLLPLALTGWLLVMVLALMILGRGWWVLIEDGGVEVGNGMGGAIGAVDCVGGIDKGIG